MTARLDTLPVWVLDCQGKGCPATFSATHPRPEVRQQQSLSQWNLRRAARAAGWQTRAPRTRKPDLCPACKPQPKDPR